MVVSLIQIMWEQVFHSVHDVHVDRQLQPANLDIGKVMAT